MVCMVSGIICTEENKMFLRYIQNIFVTGTGVMVQGFSESTSGAMSMLTTRESSILLISSETM